MPRLGAARRRDRTEDELLVQLGGAAVDRAADQVGVAGLELVRAERRGGSGRGSRSPGASRSIRCLHPVGEPLAVVGVPRRRGCRLAGVARRVLRHVRVGPHRLGAGRRPGRVGGRHLAGQQERAGRAPRRAATWPSASVICSTRVGDVHRAGAYGGVAGPRHRAVERPVDLDRGRVELEARMPSRRRAGQVLGATSRP